MTDIELILNSNTSNHLNVCNKMSAELFENVTYKLFVYFHLIKELYIIN